jgi:hypothetical protein
MPANTRRVLLLSLIAIIAVGVLLHNQSTARHQQQAIRTLNVADRQRVLSQRVAGLAMELATHANVPRPAVSDDAPVGGQDKDQTEADVRDQLRQAIALMQSAHTALINGSDDLGVSAPKAPELVKVYFAQPYELDHAMIYFLAAANAVADTPSTELNDQSKPLAALENAAREPLLTALNAAVSAYEAESARVLHRQYLAVSGLATAILVIAIAELMAAWRAKA